MPIKVKATVEGHEFEPLISFQLHIFFTPVSIFIKLWSNVRLSEPQNHCRLKAMVIIESQVFESALYLLYPWEDFY